MKSYLICLLLVLLPSLGTSGQGVSVTAAISYSGDEILVTLGEETTGVRLFGIDAPELDQPYGEESKANLENLINDGLPLTIMGDCQPGKLCTARVFDKYGWSLSALQVKKGFAWATKKTDAQTENYADKARKKHWGLWAANEPIPPWEWRDPEKYYERKRLEALTQHRIDNQPKRGSQIGGLWEIFQTNIERNQQQALMDEKYPPSDEEKLRREMKRLRNEISNLRRPAL